MLAALSPSARRQASPARGAARITASWRSGICFRGEWPELNGRNAKAAFRLGGVSFGPSGQKACSSLDGCQRLISAVIRMAVDRIP